MDYRDFNNLPTWLPKKIEKTGLRMTQIANRAGISRATLYEYLADTCRPSGQVALRLSRVLGVTFEQILAQYTPSKIGRPVGSRTKSELRVRRK